MNPRQIKQSKKDRFLVSLVRDFNYPREKILELLRTAQLAYNEEEEPKLKEQVRVLIKNEKDRLYQEFMKKRLLDLKPTPCWLAETPGVMCEGEQLPAQNGKNFLLPRCSIGGIRHWWVWKSHLPDKAALLAKVGEIDIEKEQANYDFLVWYWPKVH